MSKATHYLPQGYSPVTPYLIVDNAAEALEFYQKAFGAVERFRMDAPGGKIGHAEIEINGAVIMLSDEAPEWDAFSPKSVGGTPVSIHIYVPDVDATYQQAIAAGATAKAPVVDKFYGDRSGCLVDPFGHAWSIATHVEDVSPEEMKKRAEAVMA